MVAVITQTCAFDLRTDAIPELEEPSLFIVGWVQHSLVRWLLALCKPGRLCCTGTVETGL